MDGRGADLWSLKLVCPDKNWRFSSANKSMALPEQFIKSHVRGSPLGQFFEESAINSTVMVSHVHREVIRESGVSRGPFHETSGRVFLFGTRMRVTCPQRTGDSVALRRKSCKWQQHTCMSCVVVWCVCRRKAARKLTTLGAAPGTSLCHWPVLWACEAGFLGPLLVLRGGGGCLSDTHAHTHTPHVFSLTHCVVVDRNS